jgi:hypothetical protein
MGKKLNLNSPTESFVKQGEELEIRCGALPECVPMVESVKATTSIVRNAMATRQVREHEIIPIRVRCDFADSGWDQTVRAAASATEIQTGGKKGPVYREMFPNGLTPLIIRSGEPQLQVADSFLRHLTSCKAQGAETVIAEWRPKLQQARDTLASALADRKTAEAALALAREDEQGAKREFSRSIDKMIGQIRQLFPENRVRQDLIFPSLVESSVDSSIGGPADSEETTEVTPAAPGTFLDNDY